jgi:pimeloyl-ACP methyl ester carboxylesterase
MMVAGNGHPGDGWFSPLHEKSLRLPDGRGLGWAEYGLETGRPLLYCHGCPGSRREAGFAAAAAERLGLRLLAVDRPGYGKSTGLPDRTLQSCAEDLAWLAARLGLENILILGVSGGGPFAAATARRLAERAEALGLVCPVGPLTGPGSPAGLPLRWSLLRLIRPRGLLWRWLAAFLARRAESSPERVLHWVGRRLGPADRQLLADPGVRPLLVSSLAEALSRKGRGLVPDLQALAGPWGFDPAELTCPVRIWHGLDDRIVPPAFSRALASRMATAGAVFLAGEGHFSLPILQAETILRDLAAAGKRKQPAL